MAEDTGVTTPRESTSQDYWNVVNPAAIPYSYPETRFNAYEDTKNPLEIDSPEFKEYFDGANIHTQKQMLNAFSTEDAIKIAQKNLIFEDSAKAVSQDGLATQLMMGAVPAFASPSSLLPAGAIFKAASFAKTANKLYKIGSVAAAGAITGAAANIADEALFDAQGLPTNYLGAGAMGAIFGGSLGALGGALSGPYRNTVANAVTPENDTFTKNYTQDPDMLLKYDENGVPQIVTPPEMRQSLVDRVPLIGSWLRSDIHTLYQSDNALLREYTSRIASPTVALKDAEGTPVPIKMTGIDFKRKLKGIHNQLVYDMDLNYHEARKAGYTGSRSKMNHDVYMAYVSEMNRQRKEALAFANAKVGERNLDNITDTELSKFLKDFRDAQNEWYDANPAKFEGNEHIVKGAESYRDYFKTMLESGKGVGLEQLKDLNVNRLYAPRVYDYKAIHKGKVSPEQVESQVREALLSDPRNRFKDATQLQKATDAIKKMLMETAFDLNNLTNSFLVKDLPFETHLKAKKLYLDESKMPDLLVSDFGDLAGMYHYKMSGRQAVQFAFGTDDVVKIMQDIRDEHLSRGVVQNEKEIQAFDRSIKDLVGDLRINGLADTAGWNFTRNLMTYNSTRMGGGFGGNQFVELASSMSLSGIHAIMSGRLLTSLKSSAKVLYGKNRTGDEFSDYLIASGYMSDALHTSRINRFADTEAGFNSGTLETSLNWMNDKLMKYNGMRYFMGTMEDYAGGAVVTQLKKGKVDAKRLARWGLTEAEGRELGTALNRVTQGEKWALDELTTKQQDLLQLAISRGIDEIVVQGDSIHLPAWMKVPNAFRQVLFQFMRFPLIAQEVLMRRGFSDDQARMAASIFASSLTYMGMKYMREQAAIALGQTHEIDAKYDYSDPKAIERALLESLNYNAPLGFASSIYNYGAIASGQPELGRDWQNKDGMPALLGPSYGLGEDLIQLIRAGVNGNLNDERNLQRFKSLTPFMNLPLINEAGKALAEEYGR